MSLRARLGLFFGSLLIVIMSAQAAILYWQIRSSFIRRSAEEASRIASTAVEQGGRRIDALTGSMSGLSQDFQVGLLLRDAGKSAQSQRKLIDLMQALAERHALHELTAISADGVVLARGHQIADFGDAAEPAVDGAVYLPEGTTLLKLRLPVRIQNRPVGKIEGAVELAEDLADMSRRFSGDVTLRPGSSAAGEMFPLSFEFAATRPWRLADGTVLADLVFSRKDDESRTVFQKLMARLGLIFLFSAAAVGYFVMRLSDTVTRPIRQLARAASDISRGSRLLDLPPPSGDEVGELSAAFGRMASSLDESKKKLAAAERLAAWQDAARMLAHEIKNPLSPIKTVASTLARAAREKDARIGEAAERGASIILNEISHLEKLLSEFSSFARFPAPNPSPGDFNAAVRWVVEGFQEKSKDVRWVERYDDGIPRVMIDSGMFSEVVRNLILNALDAMNTPPSSGAPAARIIHLETSRNSSGAELTLADSGPGIAADKRQTLFTPYFTTKPGGTGLGLAISRKIMIEHGGDLFLVDPSPFDDARGAAFCAKLPPMPEVRT